jgi:hypothetical protein
LRHRGRFCNLAPRTCLGQLVFYFEDEEYSAAGIFTGSQKLGVAVMNGRRLGLSVLLMVFGPVMATAQTETLGYMGSAFTSLSITGNLQNGLQNAVPENTGLLVLSSPLGDNLHNAPITPISWSFDSSTQFGSIYLNSKNPFAVPGAPPSFLFSTDAHGVLTGWNIDIVAGILSGTNSPSFASVTITNAGDTYSSGFSTPSCGAAPGVVTPCFTVSESTLAPGHWSSAVSSAPEIDPASAASGFTLFFGILAVMRSTRKRVAKAARPSTMA